MGLGGLPLIFFVPIKDSGVEKFVMAGVSVLIVVGRWYCRRLPDVGSGWWVREVKWSSAGYLCSILAAVSRCVSRALTYHVATGNM